VAIKCRVLQAGHAGLVHPTVPESNHKVEVGIDSAAADALPPSCASAVGGGGDSWDEDQQRGLADVTATHSEQGGLRRKEQDGLHGQIKDIWWQ
jgi:hypothetical protein